MTGTGGPAARILRPANENPRTSRTVQSRSALRLLPFLPLLLLASCRTYLPARGERESLVLRTVDSAEGEVSYSLYSSGRSQPKVHRTRVERVEKARLGIVVRTLGIEAAAERGLEPWRGVLVESVTDASAADRAGLRRGDLLVSLAGTDLSSRDQLEELIDVALRPGEPVAVGILREELAGAQGDAARRELVLELVPDATSEEARVTDPFELSTSRLVRALTGMQLGGVDADLAREAFEADGPLVVIGNVQVGSPAYFAGLRFGDRILACDGRAVGDVVDVHEAVLARARHRGLRTLGLEEPDLDGRVDHGLENRQGPLELHVDGPLGPHLARVALDDDLDAETSFDVPILLDYSSSVRRRSVSFLDFIFQFGFNYKRTYQPSEDRWPQRSRYLSILPFGMFEFESTPEGGRQTWFWFITFRTRR